MHFHKHIRPQGPNVRVRQFLREDLTKNGAHRSSHTGQTACAQPVTRTRKDASAPPLSKTSKTLRSQLETPWPESRSSCRRETRSINFSLQPGSLTRAAHLLPPARPYLDPPPSFQASKFSASRSSALTKGTRLQGQAWAFRAVCSGRSGCVLWNLRKR